jgi:hypothetical protein
VNYTGRYDENNNPIVYYDGYWSNGGIIALEVGKTYFVKIESYDGTENFKLVAEDYSSDWITIGNKKIVNTTKEDTGENFCIMMSKSDFSQIRMYSQGYYGDHGN